MIKILLIFSAILLCCLIVLTIYILYRNKRQQSFSDVSHTYQEHFYEDWHNHLIENHQITDKLLPTRLEHYEAIEKIFLAYGKQYKGEHTVRNILQFADEYMGDYYRAQLKNKKWSTRINALYRIFDFKLFRIVPSFDESYLRKLDSEERLQWLKIYTLLDATTVVQFLKQYPHLFSELEHKQLFSLVDEPVLVEICKDFDSFEEKAQLALIDIVAINQNKKFHTLFVNQLASKNVEVRIRVLKNFEYVPIKPTLEELTPSLLAESWEERLMGTKLLKYYNVHQYKLLLDTLQFDENKLIKKEAKRLLEQEQSIYF